VRIEGRIEGDSLHIELIADQDLKERPTVVERVEESQAPDEVRIGRGNRSRVRSTGKSGYEVSVYRITGNRRELISADTYPPMNRTVEYR
jgi:hypothetical protein